MHTEHFIAFLAEYTSPALPKATPSRRAGHPGKRRSVSSKRKRRLTQKQERRRIEGLRILARIIARHYLANPHLYPNGADGDGSAPSVNGRTTADGETPRKEGAA